VSSPTAKSTPAPDGCATHSVNGRTGPAMAGAGIAPRKPSLVTASIRLPADAGDVLDREPADREQRHDYAAALRACDPGLEQQRDVPGLDLGGP
jgi:hypothetical protein